MDELNSWADESLNSLARYISKDEPKHAENDDEIVNTVRKARYKNVPKYFLLCSTFELKKMSWNKRTNQFPMDFK